MKRILLSILNLFQRQFASFICVLLNACKIYRYRELFKERQTVKTNTMAF